MRCFHPVTLIILFLRSYQIVFSLTRAATVFVNVAIYGPYLATCYIIAKWQSAGNGPSNKNVFFLSGSISNIDGAEYHCNKTQVRKVISGVVGAASSVTSIQVANLLRLFKIPQVM